jgi:signal transduction histidine kinase/sensor domain CHASE-containing protein
MTGDQNPDAGRQTRPQSGASAAARSWSLRALYRRIAQQPAIPVILIVFLFAGMTSALVYTASRSQDHVAFSRSVALVEAIFQDQILDLGREALDYAYWDKAVENLSGVPDTAWADENIGSYAYEYLDVTASLVIPPLGDPTIAFVSGNLASTSGLRARLSGGLEGLVGAARAASPEEPHFESSLLAFDGQLYMAGAAAITPETGDLRPEDAALRPVLVFLRVIDADFLANTSQAFGIENLHLTDAGTVAAPPASALRGFDGSYLGRLEWHSERPGRDLIRMVVLPIAVAFAGVVVLAGVVLRIMTATGRNLQSSLALLARRNEELSISERAASNTRVRLQSALDYSPEAIAFFDADERLVVCNERFRRLMHPGFRHLVAPGQTLSAYCDLYVEAWFGNTGDGGGETWLERLRATHGQQGGTTEIGMASGRWMLMRERRTADGGFVMLFTDITELHGRQISLSDRSSRLQVTLDTLREGVAVYDPNQRLVLWNRRLSEILDVPHDSLKSGGSFEDIQTWFLACTPLDQEDDDRPAPMLPPSCPAELPEAADYLTPENRIVKVRYAPAPEGGVVVTLRDVTERRRAELELRGAMENAKLANRSKTEFLANVSHELRTPLNAIIGFSEIMKDEMFGPLGTPNYCDYANDIHESGRHLLALINDILDLSKVEAGRIELNEEVVDIAAVSTSALRIVRERAHAAGLTIGVEIPKDLPPVMADQRAIKQILINLLSNAIKFTPEGGLVTLRGHVNSEGALRLSVIDNGIGIAQADIPVALAPFGQVESALSRSTQGTGLGLPLSVALAEEHGGCIEVSSEPDEGTRVTFTLPADRVGRHAETA